MLPRIGSIVALVDMGVLYHGYRQVRNWKVNEALVQGIESARAIVETTPRGQATDAAFLKWLIAHQIENDVFVFATISMQVNSHTGSPAAKLIPQQIIERVQRVQSQPSNAGAAHYVVQQLVGHGSPARTEHCTHLDEQQRTDAVAGLLQVIVQNGKG